MAIEIILSEQEEVLFLVGASGSLKYQGFTASAQHALT